MVGIGAYLAVDYALFHFERFEKSFPREIPSVARVEDLESIHTAGKCIFGGFSPSIPLLQHPAHLSTNSLSLQHMSEVACLESM